MNFPQFCLSGHKQNCVLNPDFLLLYNLADGVCRLSSHSKSLHLTLSYTLADQGSVMIMLFNIAQTFIFIFFKNVNMEV